MKAYLKTKIKSILKLKLILLISLLGFNFFGLVVNAASKPIIFATEATYPPFVYMQPNGKMAGFGVSVVHAVCKQMHAKCKLVNVPFESLIPGLELGKFNVIFGGLGITANREKVINFTTPYYNNAVTYVVNKKSPLKLNLKNMSGKIIGVQGGSTFESYLQGTYGSKITIKTYASNMTALLDLKEGRINAVFLDKPVAKVWLAKSGNSGFETDGNIMSVKYFGPGDGMGVSKSNPKLLAQINQAIKTIKSNGVYQKIETHWFGK
jgi:arginine transport system substrate-binding protein